MNPLSINPLALFASAVVALAVGFGGGWQVNGWRLNAQIADRDKQDAQMSAAAAKQLADATAVARTREQALEALYQAEQGKRLQEDAYHAKNMAYWRDRALAGSSGLSVAAAPGSVSRCATSTDTVSAGGSVAEARTDLLPATAAAIQRIAANDARLVRDYNAVVDAYNAVRDTCNGR